MSSSPLPRRSETVFDQAEQWTRLLIWLASTCAMGVCIGIGNFEWAWRFAVISMLATIIIKGGVA